MKELLESHTSMALGATGIVVSVLARLYTEVRLRRWRRELLRPFEDPPESLERGLRSFVGTVETDDSEGIVIRVIYPSAEEVAPHRARDCSFDEARGFTLVLSATDARVWVEPEERYCLRVVSTEHQGPPEPQRAHIVRAGDRVLVSGLLVPARRAEGGYRGPAHDFTLRPPDGGELEITSEAFQRAAAREARVIVACVDVIWGAPALAHLAFTWLDRGQNRWPNALLVTAILLWSIVVIGSLSAIGEIRRKR